MMLPVAFKEQDITVSKHQILIAGCGDIGSNLGSKLAAQGHRIIGLRRNINQLPPVIQGIAADLNNPALLQQVLQQLTHKIDIVIYAVAAGKRDEQCYREAYLEGLQNLLYALQHNGHSPKQLLFVSSTAVYQQSEHQWIDETSATEPEGFSGQIMLQAEQLALNNTIPGCVVRFSGIYGPGRNYMLNQVSRGIGYPKQPLSYSNRIHRDDCVGVLQHLIGKVGNETLESVYLASDCSPSPLSEVTDWLAEQLGTTITEPNSRRVIGSKRCNNQRLLDSGYQFKFPDFRQGYQQLIKDFNV